LNFTDVLTNDQMRILRAGIDARVRIGALLLDTYYGQWGLFWFDFVNYAMLDMHEHCLLTQLFGTYNAGLAALNLAHGRDHGFIAHLGDLLALAPICNCHRITPGELRGMYYCLLTERWKVRIAESFYHRTEILTASDIVRIPIRK